MSSGSITDQGQQVHRALPNSMWEPNPKTALPVMPVESHVSLSDAGFGHTPVVVPRLSWYIPCKRWVESFFAVVLLVLASPIIILGAVLVKLSSRGPAFYRQVRVGLNGRTFTLFKLRTMRQDAEVGTGPVWSTENDPRITPLGQLLRCTHIDEFPQLWNVARGEMSLVGPRPERPEFVARLDWEIPSYRERLQVRPGITGLAQLRLPADASLDCVRRKVIYDVYYVRYLTPWLDIKLLCLTAGRLLKELYKFCCRGVALPGADEIERGYQLAVGIAPPLDEFEHVSLNSIIEACRELKINELSDVSVQGAFRDEAQPGSMLSERQPAPYSAAPHR
jgi:lipopolysaccharide/colanic/teichoic acid biosynthesis glycosyltransferase